MDHPFPYGGYVNLETDASYNFVAPCIPEDAGKKIEVVFPTVGIAVLEGSSPYTAHLSRSTTWICIENGLAATARLNLVADTAALAPGTAVMLSVSVSGSSRRSVIVSLNGSEICTMTFPAYVRSLRALVWDGNGFIEM